MAILDTVIIGAGQAGLGVSYFLQQKGYRHILFEKGRVGESWLSQRWDSFQLNTPNLFNTLPGLPYDGKEADGFWRTNDLVDYLQEYVRAFQLPVRTGVTVLSVDRADGGEGFEIKTRDQDQAEETVRSRTVVVASGIQRVPRFPATHSKLPAEIFQLHTAEYRNPQGLPPGAVVVVGSGQSGCQITEDLLSAGRTVYLCTSKVPRVPRRYRGRDIVAWLVETGFFNQTVDKLPSPKARFGANPQATGRDGGHNLNLHQFVRDGVTLFGHIADAQDGKVMFKSDLKENLARSDKAEKDIIAMIDKYIEANGLNAPQETLPDLQDGYSVEEIIELDLKTANINTVIWAMGYTADYSLVKLPITDEDGFPITRHGVTQYPGLYFIGINWLSTRKSVTLMGVREDVESIIADMTK